MSKHIFEGLGVALITPFCADGSIDYSSLEKLINYQIDNGIDYLVALGTTSEAATMSDEERFAVLNFVKEINNKRVPIVVGAGGNNTVTVLDNIKKVEKEGVDGLLSVTPYYNKPNQNGLFEHFKAVANSTKLPVILYNVPGRTGVNMSAQTTVKLAKQFTNVLAVKEASGNLPQAMDIIQNSPEHFAVISGDDALTMPLISLGAKGVISVVGNAYPKQFSQMVNYSLQNDFASARDFHYQLVNMIDALFEEGNPVGVKSLLQYLGLIDNNLRLPLVKSSQALDDKIKLLADKIK